MSAHRGLAVVTVVIALAGHASAHHSATMFEPTRTITVEGIVKEFQLEQPAFMVAH